MGMLQQKAPKNKCTGAWQFAIVSTNDALLASSAAPQGSEPLILMSLYGRIHDTSCGEHGLELFTTRSSLSFTQHSPNR